MKIPSVFYLRSLIREKLLPHKKIRLALSSNFPGASDVEWSVRNNTYEATFMQKGNFTTVSFDDGGALKEKKISRLEKQLPASILDILHKKYNMLFLVSATEIDGSDTGIYEIIIDTTINSRILLRFDSKSNIIKEQLLFAIKKDFIKNF